MDTRFGLQTTAKEITLKKKNSRNELELITKLTTPGDTPRMYGRAVLMVSFPFVTLLLAYQ